MLILNNGKEATRLKQSMIDKLREEIGNKGIKLQYVERLMKVRKYTDGSSKRVGPASKGILMLERVTLNMDSSSENYLEYDPKGESVLVRYAVHLRFDKHGNPEFAGNIDRPQTIEPSEYELYWFLTRCSSMVANSKNVKIKHTCPYEIEQREVHATVKRQSLQAQKTVEFKLMADEAETGVGKKTIERIAASYWIEDAADMAENNENELRMLILDRVQIDERTGQFSGEKDNKGWNFFLSLLKDDEQQSNRELINKLCAKNLIAWDETYRKWCYVADVSKFGSAGYLGATLLKVPSGSHYMGLLKELKKHDFKEALDALLKEEAETPTVKDNDSDEAPAEKAKRLEKEGNLEEALALYREIAKDPSQKAWTAKKIKDIESKLVEDITK